MVERDDLVSDRYLLDQPVASGTTGEVWKATDTRLDRPVAVKFLRADPNDAEAALARFTAEATVVAALSAPQLAAVHDYGETVEGETVRPYLVMEWIDGRPLSALIAESGRLPLDDTVRIVTETAAALHIAHEAGIVHRDVKPGNILVTATGAVKLIDFGIAAARGDSGRDETGTIVGTPAYLSPEQITGWRLTPGADVYGLGIVAYECLAGAPPFESDKPTDVLAAHLTRPPGPLPAHIPPVVADVIAGALRKRAANRWPSAAEFATALGAAVLAAIPPPEPTVAESATKPDTGPVPKPHRRRMALQLVGLTTVVLLLTVAALSLWPRSAPGSNDEHAAATQESPGPIADDESSESAESADDTVDEESGNVRKPGEAEPATDSQSPEESEDDEGGGSGQTVPNIVGTATKAVAYELRQHGFDNSAGKPQSEEDGEPNCVVTQQTPKAGSKVHPNTTIVFLYREPAAGCVVSSRFTALGDPASVPSWPNREGARPRRPKLG